MVCKLDKKCEIVWNIWNCALKANTLAKRVEIFETFILVTQEWAGTDFVFKNKKCLDNKCLLFY